MWFGDLSKYIQGKLPDIVQDHYKEIFGTIASPSILTHLKRELIQAVWKHFITDEFKHIYKMELSYAAHNNCIKKARRKIFQKGYAATGKAIDCIVGESFVPVENAFSQLLLPNNQKYFGLYVLDLLHEFEIGVWKQVFSHLIHMLYTYGPDAVAELDHR
ncbi:hypothetical protein C0995_006164 [Termitomyces sp. Mi166|nr:hypothetical protein C0995_006164 [Termitomyces sp. Mi166\